MKITFTNFIYGGVMVCAVAGSVYSYTAYQAKVSGGELGDDTVITFLDVGQGDAIHIRTRTNQDVVIDGGPDDSVVRRVGEAMPFWDRTIELVILSHPDADHITGLIPLFEYYNIEQIAMVDLPAESAVHRQLMSKIEQHGTEILRLHSGDTITLSPVEELRVVYPFVDTPVRDMPKNDTSIVLEYIQADTTVLFTGDIADDVELDMLQAGVLHDVDVLKVAHHGSKSSSAAEFLQAVHPQSMVIQVAADNRYGHPHTEVLDRLHQYGPVLRNDLLGNITLHVNDGGYWFEDPT